MRNVIVAGLGWSHPTQGISLIMPCPAKTSGFRGFLSLVKKHLCKKSKTSIDYFERYW